MYVSVLSRYLIKTYLEKFLLVTLVVASTLVLSSVFDVLHRIKGTNLSYIVFLQLSLFKTPYLFMEVLPLVGMLTMFLMNYTLGKSNELLIMSSSGISIYKILSPILLLNFAMGIIAITIANPFATYALKKYDKIDATVTDRKLPYLTLSNIGIMITEDYENEHRIYVAKSVIVGERKMIDVSVFFTDENNNFNKRIEAEVAYFNPNNKLMLTGVSIFTNDFQNTTYQEYELPSKLIIENLIDGVTPPEYVTFWRLPNIMNYLSQAGFSIFKHQLHYYKILLKPLSLISYILYAMCFMSYNERGKNII
ncbi:MAG: hypothetical protein RLZZ59_362, partial [Pseudomonadota bacterium]